MTEQGNIETLPNAFGNHWQTDPSCSKMSVNVGDNPCDLNAQRKAQAEALCDKLKSSIFAGMAHNFTFLMA